MFGPFPPYSSLRGAFFAQKKLKTRENGEGGIPTPIPPILVDRTSSESIRLLSFLPLFLLRTCRFVQGSILENVFAPLNCLFV